MYIPSYTHTHTYSRTTALNLYLSDLFRNLFSISYSSFLDLSALIYIFDFPIYIYIVYGIVRERFEMKYSRERERYIVYYHLTCITTSSGFKWAQQNHKLHYIKQNLTNPNTSSNIQK